MVATVVSASAGDSGVEDQFGCDDGDDGGTAAVAIRPPSWESFPSPKGSFLSKPI